MFFRAFISIFVKKDARESVLQLVFVSDVYLLKIANLVWFGASYATEFY